MLNSVDFSIGEFLGNSDLENFFINISVDESGNNIFSTSYLVDGVRYEGDFWAKRHIGRHTFAVDGVDLFIEFVGKKSDLYKICERADKYNKTILGYVGNKYKQNFWRIRCDVCESESVKEISNFGACKVCNSLSYRFNLEEFILKANEVHGSKYCYDNVVSVNARDKIEIFCNSCLTVFKQRKDAHLSGSGCPVCKESKGELRVAKYLSSNNISFFRQKTFDKLRGVKPLKYDFYLPDHNKLIEYDGEGHYKPIFGRTPESKQKNLEKCQKNDMIKNKFAKDNNISLLRIPYWDFEILEELVKNFLFTSVAEESEIMFK